MAKLKVTWRKSAIGYAPNQRRTIRALGLRRLGQTVEHSDSPAIRGMIHTIRHLIEVQEVAE
jgi:large subunit ribosomal protein L30